MKLKEIKLLYLSCHSAAEYDDLKLFQELGIQVFSHGSYVNPQCPGDPKRPNLNLPYDPHFVELCSKYTKEKMGKELVETFNVIYSLWMPHWVIDNWEVLKDKMVIFRTIGQSVPNNELSLKALYENPNFKIVRYSPQEELIPGYIGADAIIRFYKDPEEFKDWNGKENRVITVGQSMKHRTAACGFEFFEKATKKFERRLFGPGNSDSGIAGGILEYEALKKVYRDNRVYFYTGTQPACYTMNGIEAMMCFPPETLADSDTPVEDVLEKDYEGDLITIETKDEKVACTPTHPFLTTRGFVRADNLSVKDNVVIRKDTNYEKLQTTKKRKERVWMDRKRIKDIAEEFTTSKKKNSKVASPQNIFRDIGNDEKVKIKQSELMYFRSDEIFFDTLRDMLLSRNSGRRRNFKFQTKQKKQQNSSDIFSFNNNSYSNKMDAEKVSGSKKSTNIYSEKVFRETKNSLYILLKGLATITSFRGVKTLSLNQKRALWNIDFFHQESSETKIRNKIFSIRNRLLQQDKIFKQARIIKISRKFYKGKIYNLSTKDGVYWANNFLVHNTGIPIVSIGPKLGDVSFVKEQRSFEMHKIIKNGESGFWSDDIDCLEKRVGEFLEDENLAKRISQAGRERAIELFGKEKIKKQWKDFFESL